MDTITHPPVAEDEARKSEAFYQAMMTRIERQMQGIVVLDQKTGVWLQFGPVVMTLLLGLLVAAKDGANWVVGLIAVLGLVAFLGATVEFYRAHRPAGFKHGQNWEDLSHEARDPGVTATDFFYGLAVDLGRDAYPYNNQVLDRKKEHFERAARLFSGATFAMLVAVLIALLRAI